MDSSGAKRRISVAPTLHKPRLHPHSEDGATRCARLRIDEVAVDFPDQETEPAYAYVNLLQPPRDGQPVIWAKRGTNRLTLFSKATMRRGVAFVVTGIDDGDARSATRRLSP